jgi:hypothetical protein
MKPTIHMLTDMKQNNFNVIKGWRKFNLFNHRHKTSSTCTQETDMSKQFLSGRKRSDVISKLI